MTRTAQRAAARESELLQRLQNLLYEYHALGRFEEACPHILWLMEIVQREESPLRPSRPS